MSQDFEGVARTVAKQLMLLGQDGNLIMLDSLMIIDYVTQLEKETGLSIPTADLREQSFSSLAAVAQVLERASKS